MWIRRKEFEELKASVEELVTKMEKDNFINNNKPLYKFGQKIDDYTVVKVEVVENRLFALYLLCGEVPLCSRYKYEYTASNGEKEIKLKNK